MAGVREVMRPRVPGARAREGVAWLAVPRDLGEEEEEEEEEEEDALPEPPASSPPFASLFSRSSLALVSSHRIALPTCRARCSKLCACMQGQATPTPEELAGRLRAFNGSHRIRRTHRAWVGAQAQDHSPRSLVTVCSAVLPYTVLRAFCSAPSSSSSPTTSAVVMY